jgi:ferritin-like metal-binding protein YciE
MAEAGTLRDAFLDELKDSYDAEKQLTKALPKLAKASTSAQLRAAFESHLVETREHVARIEQAFELLEEKAKRKHCDGMAGIIDEGASVMEENFDDATLDACLVASGQRAEHYEIAAYGTLIAWAKMLGHDDVAMLFEQTLSEEKAADAKLTRLADSGINQKAGDAATPEETFEPTAPSRQGSGKAAGRSSQVTVKR